MPSRRFEGDRRGVNRRARTPATRRYYAIAVVVHLVLGSLIATFAATLSVGTLALVASGSILLIMLALSLLYLRNFGSIPADRPNEGPVGLSRAYVLFVSWAVLGYLALLLAVGSALGPSAFVLGLVGFWILFAGFLVAALTWRRQSVRGPLG